MADRSRGVRERLLDVTIELIDEFGVDGVRLRDVMDRSGVTNGSLYWEFTNRRALIDAALAERYVRRLAERTEEAFGHVDTTENGIGSMLAPMIDAFAESAESELRAARADRVTVLAAALGDERLAQQVGQAQAEQITRLTELVADLQGRGRVTTDVSARSVALLVQVVSVGLSALDLPGPGVHEDWREIVAYVATQLRHDL